MKKRFSAIEQALGNNGQPPMAYPGGEDFGQGPNGNPYAGGQMQGNASMGYPEKPMGGQPGDPAMGQGSFGDIRDALMQLIREGKVPPEFDLQAACSDEAFAELLMEFPPEAAVRIYAAEKRADEAETAAMQRVTNQVKSRNALPRSSKGGAMSAPAINYRDMDGAAFRKLLGDIKKTTRNGGKVRL